MILSILGKISHLLYTAAFEKVIIQAIGISLKINLSSRIFAWNTQMLLSIA